MHEKFMRICRNGPLDKLMHSNALCIVMYGRIKFMQFKFMRPVLDSHSSHTCTCVHVNKSHAEISRFTVLCIPYFLEFFPPLNCSHTAYLALAEQNKSRPWIVPAPCVCVWLSWWAWLNIQLINRLSNTSMCSETCWNCDLRLLNCTVQLY